MKFDDDDASGDLATAVGEMTQKAIMKNATDAQQASFMAMCAIGGALTVLTNIVGKMDTEGEPGKRTESTLTEQSVLFAGLLVASSVEMHSCTDCDGPHLSAQSGMEQLMQARQWFETITGKKPDKHLNPAIAEAMQQAEQIGIEPLKQLMAGRSGQMH